MRASDTESDRDQNQRRFARFHHFSLDRLTRGEGLLKLRSDDFDERYQVKVTGHVEGHEELCLLPYASVSCGTCRGIYTREQFKRHAHATDGSVEERAPVEELVFEVTEEQQALVEAVEKRAAQKGNNWRWDPNLVCLPMMRLESGKERGEGEGFRERRKSVLIIRDELSCDYELRIRPSGSGER